MYIDKKLSVLQVTTYPIDEPDHGGKFRCFNIRKFLRNHFNVQTVSFEMIEGDDCTDGFKVKLNKETFMKELHGKLPWAYIDWGYNIALDSRDSLYEKLTAKIKKYNPDIIFLEQPFLGPLVEKMKKSNVVSDKCFVVYSSHNIEFALKAEIYKDVFSGEELQKKLNMVKNIELDAISSANMSIAVSQEDVDFIKKISPDQEVFLYQNGHSIINETPNAEKWQKLFSQAQRNWVFVGSWHPPNINGIYNLITNSLMDLDSSKVKLWVLGSVGLGLEATYSFENKAGSPIEIITDVTNEDIDSAIMASSGIVLPVWEGGGSNLKTVQALLSRKAIISTKHAFRGLDEYVTEDGVTITDSPDEIVAALNGFPLRDLYDRELSISTLPWDKILSTLPDKILYEYSRLNS